MAKSDCRLLLIGKSCPSREFLKFISIRENRIFAEIYSRPTQWLLVRFAVVKSLVQSSVSIHTGFLFSGALTIVEKRYDVN